jgi:ATP-dependent Zn protease
MTALTTNPVRRPGLWPWIAGLVAIAVVVATGSIYAWISVPAASTVGYSQFLADVQAGRVTEVVQIGTTLEVKASNGAYSVMSPTVLTDVYADVNAAAAAGEGVVPQFSAQPEADTSWIGLVLTAVLPFAVVLVVFVLVLLLIVRPARAQGARSLTVRLLELDEAHRSGLITDDEWHRQRARVLDES